MSNAIYPGEFHPVMEILKIEIDTGLWTSVN